MGKSLPIGSAYISKMNPATGQELHKIPQSTEEDVNQAVELAKANLGRRLKHTSFEYRSQCLYRLANLLEGRLEESAVAETNDTGKPVWLDSKC